MPLSAERFCLSNPIKCGVSISEMVNRIGVLSVLYCGSESQFLYILSVVYILTQYKHNLSH